MSQGRARRCCWITWLVLVVVSLRVILPVDEQALGKGAERRHDRVLLVATMALVGVFTGLLANGGGFLIVPLYLLFFVIYRIAAH